MFGFDPDYIDVFFLPPPPRAADFSAWGRWRRRLTWGSYVAIFVLGLLFAAQRWQRAGAIDAARTATARILAKERAAGRGRVHYILFAFTPEGAWEIQIEVPVRPTQYDSISVGQEMPVHYLPEDPASNWWLFDYEEARQKAYKDVPFILLVFSIGPLLYFIPMEWIMRRERDLARRGELTTGEITAAWVSKGGARGATTYWIGFVFPLPSGCEGQGSSKVPLAYYQAKGRRFEPVGVLWDPRQPRRCQPLPALRFTAFPSAVGRHCVSLRIRIVSPPPGEAPANIRAAWVGCVLPLFATTDDPSVDGLQEGVLSRQPEGGHQGFVVRVVDAVRELERHNAEAALWWRDNTPHALEPGKLFVFPHDACALVEDTETPR
jgi:hypothetical protein